MNGRLAALALLVLSLGLYLTAIDWGLPSSDGWDYDETMPVHVNRSIRHGVGGGWFLRYPPFHFRILKPLFLGLHALDEAGWIEADRARLHTLEFLLIRVVSVAMAMGTVLCVVFVGRRVFGPRAALLGAALHAFSLTAVYYAKAGNLDVPYVFWFSLALLALVRLLEADRARDWLVFGGAAGAAVATKDQAYALFTLAPLALLWTRWRRAEGAGSPWRRAVRALLDRRLAGAALVAAATFAFGHGLPGERERFLAHVRLITTPEAGFPSSYAPTLAGQAEMAVQACRQLGFTLGWPGLLAAAGGVILVLARGRREPGRVPALAMLLLAASCYLTLLAVIRSVIDRYLLGPQLVLALFGGRLLAAALAWERFPAWSRRLAVGCVLGFSFLRGLSLDLHMLHDSRYAFERWAAERQAEGRGVVALGRKKVLPRIATLQWRGRHATLAPLASPEVSYVVHNVPDLVAPGEKEIVSDLEEGRLGFRLLFRYRSKPWLDLVDVRGISTNLTFVNPELAVYGRDGLPPVAPPAP